MPAYRERIYICPAENGQPGWIMEFPLWWKRDKFFEHYGERRFDTGNPIYVDYGMLVAGWEAKAWDEQCRKEFAHDPRSREGYFVDAMRLLESRLGSASWVVVESYEWESGLS